MEGERSPQAINNEEGAQSAPAHLCARRAGGKTRSPGEDLGTGFCLLRGLAPSGSARGLGEWEGVWRDGEASGGGAEGTEGTARLETCWQAGGLPEVCRHVPSRAAGKRGGGAEGAACAMNNRRAMGDQSARTPGASDERSRNPSQTTTIRETNDPRASGEAPGGDARAPNPPERSRTGGADDEKARSIY